MSTVMEELAARWDARDGRRINALSSLGDLSSYEPRRDLIAAANRYLHIGEEDAATLASLMMSTAEDFRALQPVHVVDVHNADEDAYKVTYDVTADVVFHANGEWHTEYVTHTSAPYDPTCMAVGGGSESSFRVRRGVLMSERPRRVTSRDVRRTAVTTSLGTAHGTRLFVGHVVVKRGNTTLRWATAVVRKTSTAPVGMRGSAADRLATVRNQAHFGALEACDEDNRALYLQTLAASCMPVRRIQALTLAERVAKRRQAQRADDARRRKDIREYATIRAAAIHAPATATSHAASMSPLDRFRRRTF